MLAKEPKSPFSFVRRASLWAYNNKFASFLLIIGTCYVATIPFVTFVEPKVSTSTERADDKNTTK